MLGAVQNTVSGDAFPLQNTLLDSTKKEKEYGKRRTDELILVLRNKLETFGGKGV